MSLYEVEKLLWQARRDDALTKGYQQDPDAVLAAYDLSDEERRALKDKDFRSILEAGANPYLLYFFALHVGVDRSDYYAAVRGEEVSS